MGGSLEALQAQGGRGAEAGKSQGKMLAMAVCSLPAGLLQKM